VHCEYPVDADDEYVTEKGFLPTLPGEYTKLSSALALFRLSRILSKVLTELYPGSASHDISFRTIASLSDELEDWQGNLAPHLKLTFAQDKPSTNVTSSRSPVLVCEPCFLVHVRNADKPSLSPTTTLGRWYTAPPLLLILATRAHQPL
jgi:hypothetical protein